MQLDAGMVVCCWYHSGSGGVDSDKILDYQIRL